jgi:AraC-like DNA-binding protein
LTREPESVVLGPMNVGMYYTGDGKLSAWRLPGERHQFLTVEYSASFLQRHLTGQEAALHPVARKAMMGEGGSEHTAAQIRFGSSLRRLAAALREPPFEGPAQGLWYQGKAMELVAELFFLPAGTSAGTATRRDETARLRVERVIEILKNRIAEPPTLEELGREVGCSQFYLSRTFSKVMNMTLAQYIRQIRMERAADLLKSGRFNVTEAALEVGYSSLSHFSQAFCEVMGCCPGLYPLGLVRSSGNKVSTAV